VNDFQRRCSQRIGESLQNAGINVEFASVQGNKEDYLRGAFDLGADSFEVYIYADELGLMANGKHWRIWERPDVDGSDELLADFVENLSKLLNNQSPNPYDGD
jgi:hypothetical protein